MIDAKLMELLLGKKIATSLYTIMKYHSPVYGFSGKIFNVQTF